MSQKKVEGESLQLLSELNTGTMECRLCLGSAPAESSVSIFGDPHPERLEQRIRTCCQIFVKRGDGLPDTVCLSCKTNLELLISFRKACFRNNESSRLRNLVVVIVIETFENIPQQQTTFPKPRRHAPAVIILNSGGTPLPVEWNQNGRNTPPPLKYIERKGAKHSRKFDASTKTKFLSYASITTSIKHSRKFDASTKTKFLSYASITTSTKHSKNTIKGGTTQTTPVDPQQQASTHSTRPVDPQQQASTHSTRPVDPQQQASTHSTRPVDPQQQASTHSTRRVDPQQQASTHSSRPVNIQLLTSHHYTTRTWKINQPDEPATHCRIQRPSVHS
ncbi:uncharacterized protein LOC143919629 isoform X2 [Arctopsyche grandis]|uniref:uncharacterized protein LOC143919629 isoform X2 n=1 Tax=Arctopsyche grandis TaxID=121162 RepID=UPI00406D735A